MKIIDISVPVSNNLPLWPNSMGLCIKRISKIGSKNLVNETHIEMNAHIGTHIDAPLHFIAKGKSIDKLPLDIFMGPVFVAYLPKVKEIGVKDLEKLSIPKGVKRILFRTSNSPLWGKTKRFKKNYVGLTESGASWIAKKGIKLVGMDYLSIAKFDEAAKVHQILLGKGICIIESLNLTGVKSGVYELICLPVKIAGSEAAPTRAILIHLS